MNNKLKHIQKLVGDKPSTWKEKSKERATKPWLREYSSQIARRIGAIIYSKDQETTQTEFANLLGVSRQQVSKILQGQENMTLESIWKLSKALGYELITFPEYRYSRRYANSLQTDADHVANGKKGKLIQGNFSHSKKDNNSPLPVTNNKKINTLVS